MIVCMPNSLATWDHVWATVRARQEELGWTDAQLYDRCKISGSTYRKGRQEGQPLQRQDKIASLEDGLGWQRGSVAAILAGGEPVEVPQTGSAAIRPDDLVERIERLELALTALARHQRDGAQSEQLDRLVVEIEAELAARRRIAP